MQLKSRDCYDSKQIQVVQHGHVHVFKNILLLQLCDYIVRKPYFTPFMADLSQAVVLQVSFLPQSFIAALVQLRNESYNFPTRNPKICFVCIGYRHYSKSL